MFLIHCRGRAIRTIPRSIDVDDPAADGGFSSSGRSTASAGVVTASSDSGWSSSLATG
jgi:hypothetical protein